MFQACEVNIANIDAHSKPRADPGNSAMKPVIVIDRKPRIGTDCRMSSSGIKTFSARRSLAAAVAYTKVNTTDSANATNMRNNDRAA
jgi:hypothetical protein